MKFLLAILVMFFVTVSVQAQCDTTSVVVPGYEVLNDYGDSLFFENRLSYDLLVLKETIRNFHARYRGLAKGHYVLSSEMELLVFSDEILFFKRERLFSLKSTVGGKKRNKVILLNESLNESAADMKGSWETIRDINFSLNSNLVWVVDKIGRDQQFLSSCDVLEISTIIASFNDQEGGWKKSNVPLGKTLSGGKHWWFRGRALENQH